MKSINVNKLAQQIKKSMKGRLVWQRTGEAEYITNTHWLVKVETTEGTKVRAALFEAFGKEVQPGQSLHLSFGTVSDSGPNCEKIYNIGRARDFGYLTPIVILAQGKQPATRLVVIGKHLLAIDNEYAEMVADETAAGTGPNEPIYFGSELLVLPIKLDEGWRSKLNSYVGAIKE